MTTRVAIFVSGGGSNMIKLLESMTGDHPARPCVVLSNDPSAGGLVAARNLGVPAIAVPHAPYGKDRAAFENALSQAIAPYAPDLICLAGFMRVLTSGFVEQWTDRMLNIHPSLLPNYKGLHTHERAIAAGDKRHGCSVHLVTPLLDDGPILGQAEVPILPDDTPQTLAARVLIQEHILYPLALRRFVDGGGAPLLLHG